MIGKKFLNQLLIGFLSVLGTQVPSGSCMMISGSKKVIHLPQYAHWFDKYLLPDDAH